jgi:hypothetical protein
VRQLAFVQAVRSQTPISEAQTVPPTETPDVVLGHPQDVASTVSDLAPFDEAVERQQLQPMKWSLAAREEISQRVATFKAHQERFIREREGYAVSTLARTKASYQQITEQPTIFNRPLDN